jgi:gliding motility-associated-like protein
LKNPVLILFFFLIFSNNIEAQNLIVNSSFEDIDSCYGQPAPIGFDVFNWTGCNNWKCPTMASSDIWCENPVFGNQSPPSLPGIGFQFPHLGENYSGILIFELTDQNYREYIQNELVTPLEVNQYYQFSIFVSTNEDSINYSSCLQAYFSSNPVSSIDYHTLPNQPQWKNPTNNFIRDTLGWQLLTGIFKANGGEKFVTIGCFDDSAGIQVLNRDPLTTSDIYYFIDDVSIEKAPIEIVFPNVFSPNEDGVNDFFEPTVNGVPDYEVFIYNRWGNLMQVLDSKTSIWNGGKASEGTYFYVLQSKETDITEQGFFQLVR